MSRSLNVFRGSVIAFAPFGALLLLTNFFAAVALAAPFFGIGARVEADGDWASPRRRTSLLVAAAFAAFGLATVGDLAGLAVLIALPVGLAFFLAAGPPDDVRNPSVVRVRRTAR